MVLVARWFLCGVPETQEITRGQPLNIVQVGHASESEALIAQFF